MGLSQSRSRLVPVSFPSGSRLSPGVLSHFPYCFRITSVLFPCYCSLMAVSWLSHGSLMTVSSFSLPSHHDPLHCSCVRLVLTSLLLAGEYHHELSCTCALLWQTLLASSWKDHVRALLASHDESRIPAGRVYEAAGLPRTAKRRTVRESVIIQAFMNDIGWSYRSNKTRPFFARRQSGACLTIVRQVHADR